MYVNTSGNAQFAFSLSLSTSLPGTTCGGCVKSPNNTEERTVAVYYALRRSPHINIVLQYLLAAIASRAVVVIGERRYDSKREGNSS